MTFSLVPKEECPRCHQRTISFWRKQVAGPGFPATCSACGAKVYISYAQGFVAGMIAFAGYQIAKNFGWGLTSWLTLAAGFTAALGFSRFSPLLEKKDNEPRSKVEQ
jgi:hypothetical protein